MEAAGVGFAIAIAVGLTGMGAGIVTAPVLMALFGVPTAAAVGTALIFGAATKIMIVPVYALRRQICFRTTRYMLATGVPGAFAGAMLLAHVDEAAHRPLVSLLIGGAILGVALARLYRALRSPAAPNRRERPWLIVAASLPIGLEVGFSSAGSGSLASLALMAFTRLSPARIVGTDLTFGLAISLVGGGVLLSSGHYEPKILPHLLGGGLVGAIVAPHLAAHIPARPFTLMLLVWIAFLGGSLVFKGISR